MIDSTIYSRFSECVENWPNNPAVLVDGNGYTFRQLDRMVDAIMARFYDTAPRRVGICMTHSVEMIAAMLAVLKSGAAYVPVEPSLPLERREFMMDAAGIELIIDDNFCRKLESVKLDMDDRSLPGSPAYILYTSGTSGQPKGVIVHNSAVVNYAEAFNEEFHNGPGDVMLQLSVCSFDIFVEEVFASLLNGSAIAIPPAGATVSGHIEELMAFVKRHDVTIVSGFPYLLADMNKLASIPDSIRLLISGGDVLRAAYIDRLRNRGARIYNTYGPSETTVCATYKRCDNIEPLPDGTFPIGHPVKGVKVSILNNRLRPVKKGAVGEICITGEGVSLGYLGYVPESVNFVILPDGRRLYRSGDLGYELPDGDIVFLHRRDDQVMILGKRVEPEEVENVLNLSPDVDKCVVRHFTDDKGLPYLVAYFVPRKRGYSLASLKNWLMTRLPDYMIPEYFVAMKSIPVTLRGKVDVEQLPIVLKDNSNY